ncbi:MAG TPA: hypothetical protein VFX70_07185 [Mycobacteriales bacterium]|nr:hypothetical protein [Mycobacteriales bacterium]
MSNDTDSDVTNDSTPTVGAVSVGGVDLLRFDPSQDIPVLPDITGAAKSVGNLTTDDRSWTDLADIGADVGDLTLNVLGYVGDPLNFLISTGLSFLVDVVQPLEDLLGLVTGNAERMGGEIDKWKRVSAALVPLSKEIRQAADSGLVGWQGRTAEQAKQRLHDFADGVAGVANDVKQVEMVMSIAQVLMATAQGLVIGLISTFVEWLIFTWVPALAAAVPTFGASTAAAGVATTAEAASATSRAVSVIDRVVGLLRRLRAVLQKIHPRLMKRVEASFRLRGPDGRFVKGWKPANVPLSDLLTDWHTYLQPLNQLIDKGADGAGTLSGGSSGPTSDQRMSQDLDENQ